MNRIFIYSCWLFFVAIFFTCSPSKHYITNKSKSINYPENDLLEIEAVAYHLNDSTTQITLQVNNENLLYKRTDSAIAFYSDLKVFYALYAANDLKNCVDSSSFYIVDQEASEEVKLKSLTNHFLVQTKFGNDYQLIIEASDLNRKSRNTIKLNLNKQDKLSRQNFKLQHANGLAFSEVFKKNELIKIYNENESIHQLMVLCFNKEIGAALPPFSNKLIESNQLKPDSSFIIQRQNGSFLFNMPEHGFYFIKASESSQLGFSLMVVDEGFPGVADMNEMINCCRYVMYKDEYDSCRNALDKKSSIEHFWLNIGGSHERAREIMKNYYLRVKEANQNYSCYLEGWKTDRGMISIVFGKATNIYKSKNDEIWVYGVETNPSALRFIFKKTQTPFSDNEYILERSSAYKEAYYQAVDYWRQGIVYSEKGLDK